MIYSKSAIVLFLSWLIAIRDINDLAQDHGNSSALAVKLPQFCSKL